MVQVIKTSEEFKAAVRSALPLYVTQQLTIMTDQRLQARRRRLLYVKSPFLSFKTDSRQGATWCGPCKLIGPVFAKMEPKFPDVLFIKVDVEEVEDVAKEYQIRSMPTFMLFKDGEKKGEMVGAVPAKLEVCDAPMRFRVDADD